MAENLFVTGYSKITWDGPSDQGPLNAHFGDEYSDIVVLKMTD